MKFNKKQEMVDPKGFIRIFRTMYLLPDFLTDDEVGVFRKAKVLTLLFVTVSYFFLPLDLLADFLFFGLGYVEDIAIAYFLLGKVAEELERFKNERTQDPKDEKIIEADFKEK